MKVRKGEIHVLVEHIVGAFSPRWVLGEVVNEALDSKLDSSWLLEGHLDRLFQNHVRAVVHLHRTEEHAELVALDFLI